MLKCVKLTFLDLPWRGCWTPWTRRSSSLSTPASPRYNHRRCRRRCASCRCSLALGGADSPARSKCRISSASSQLWVAWT